MTNPGQKIDIELPTGAVTGDKLTFSVITGPNNAMTTFSAVVPAPTAVGAPMRKISVTIPVPQTYPPGPPLQIHRLQHTPQAPRMSAADREAAAFMAEHRQRVDNHFNRTPASEKTEIVVNLDMMPYRPVARVTVSQQVRFAKPRALIDAAGQTMC